MTDVIDAIMKISHGFKSIGLEPPAAIILADHEQGMRLLGQIHQMMQYMAYQVGSERLGEVIEHLDGTAYMQAKIYGMTVQWPAVKMALPKGGYAWA
jgi:hypothetical protein